MTQHYNTLPCDAGVLIPHEPPMLLVSKLIKIEDESVEGDVSIIEAEAPETGPFVSNGAILPEYYIEVMAQAIAAKDGFPMDEGKTPATGLLTGIEDFSWQTAAKCGEIIRIQVRKTFEFGSAFIIEGTIQGISGEIARGKLKIWKLEK